MTGTENTGTPERNPGELSGAYALNALEARERAAFEAHLESSEEARIESAELSDTAVALGLATAPVQPSAALKASLMAKLSSTPQFAPLAGPASTRTTAPAADAAPAAPGLAAVPPVPPSAAGVGSRSGSGASAAERARKRWFQRPASLLAAAAAAVALFIGGTFVGLGLAGTSGTSDSFAAQQAASLAQLNAAPDVQRASATTADGHQATLVWSDTSSLSALVVDGLPALSGDKDYQLWYIGAGGAVSAGLLDTSVSASGGTAWRVLDGSLTSGDTIGMTVEPKGGSKQPTTTPIVAIQSS
ncbi:MULTISPECIES: anti-sigma factor [unclassified Cryobacterium]|uniref:anti-sigma factor n=1 Tax=unclassified Cryobacterium TaxID=2649013 RepID=UPI002AB40D54|nr:MULTISPECIES: anti-sigma factor [unclassified Cryobacterium]MDY7528966.1 anti-sigma factor [Cryobacterium sp. 10C2]MEB0200774.1 anti-sigma factor [Cryobacterium sp. 5I3]MEB0285611.1 anti-sigma factor [Cryobacterium sp. 10S3]MEB0290806.1 anti-sigma factor [Cryobacterium sp. 10C2]WPX12743.1 anti-sigma factor [Cryobacterium sp. 10S3]